MNLLRRTRLAGRHPHRVSRTHVVWGLGGLAGCLVADLAMAAETHAETVIAPWASAGSIASVILALLTWIVIFLCGRRQLDRLGNQALATIAVVSALHFVASYASRLAGTILTALTGPLSLFFSSLGSEILPCLLSAVLVTLIPKPGVFLLSNLTVFLLNAVFSGQLGPADLLFISVSMGLGELFLALLGVTRGNHLQQSIATASVGVAPNGVIARVSLAIGLHNATALFAQYCVSQVMYRLFFDPLYIAAVTLVTGLLYGMIGARIGTVLGYRLRVTQS